MSDSSGPSDPGPTVEYGAAGPSHQQMMHEMGHREFMDRDAPAQAWDGRRTVMIGYVLWLFLGWVGGHRLYVGRWRSALAMAGAGFVTWILTETLGPWLGLPMTIWWIADAVLIPGWIRAANEANAAKTAIVETV